MAKTTVIVMVDRIRPRNTGILSCAQPGPHRPAGFAVQGKAMMPTVTNVNNTSLVTASYPDAHGIVSIYWWDRAAGAEVYMESGEFVQAETMFQRATRWERGRC